MKLLAKERVLASLLVFLKKIYAVMFILPSLDVRKKRAPYFEKIQDPKKGRGIEQNDAYIIYIVVRNALVMCITLAVFLFIIALLNPAILFSLQNYIAETSMFMPTGADMLTQHSIVIAYSYSLSFLMGNATTILLPFYLLMFFINVDLKKVDILRNYAPYKLKKNRTFKRKIKAILLFSFGVGIGVLCIWWSTAGVYILADYLSYISDLYNSYIYMLFTGLYTIATQSGGALITYISLTNLIYLIFGFDRYGGC